MKKQNITTHRGMLIALAILVVLCCAVTIFAAGEDRYYLGNVARTGTDNGFSGASAIASDDPHWGWKIGDFYVDGYTRQTTDSNGNPVFLKNVGDTVTLWFSLQQNISKLNGNDKLSICEDTNGYDEYFGIPKTNFGKGTLIIRYTDHQNYVHEPVIYTNYLEAQASEGAAVEVRLFEEGDYEVALDYEIIQHNWDIFGWDPIPEYFNYRIFFRFSVRNGNCMVYPFDLSTGAELTDSSLAENGFYLDLAKSKYLDINIKKAVRTEGVEGLVEDTRFNKPAKDGEAFTDEGVYTITVCNKYTGQTTTKVIYVGTDDVLKAHVVTGLPISDIEYRLSMGATVASDGTIIENSADSEDESVDPMIIWLIVIGVVVVVVGSVSIWLLRKKKSLGAGKKTEEDNVKTPADNGGVQE